MKNKGFTLIELLAVIVVLSIITLIAVPVVYDLLVDSEEKARVKSAELVTEAVRTAYLTTQMSRPRAGFSNETVIANTEIVNAQSKSGNTITTQDGVVCTLSEFYVLTCTYDNKNLIEPVSVGAFTGIIYRDSAEEIHIGESIIPKYVDVYCLETIIDGETVNSCAGEVEIYFNTKSECESDIQNNDYPEGTKCVTRERMTSGLTEYTTDLEEMTGPYLRHDVVNGIVMKSYVCIKYEYDGVENEICLRGGDSSFYGKFDGMSELGLSEIDDVSDKNPTGNIKALSDAKESFEEVFSEENGFCEFGNDHSQCRNSSLAIIAATTGYVNTETPRYCAVDEYNDSWCNE